MQQFKASTADDNIGSAYPAFCFKVSGIQKQSLENSNKEEINLAVELLKDASIQSPYRSFASKKHLKWYTFNNQVFSVLQGFRRPMCGLAALHMGAQMLHRLKPSISQKSLEDIFNKAVELKMSKQGEMFSVHDLAKLASSLYACKAEVYSGTLHENRLHILESLLRGFPVLVPYDNDRNFEPCLQGGHKAHWAVITGAAIGSSSCLMESENMEAFPETPNLCRVKENYFANLCENLHENLDNCSQIYVFVKQGKSAKNRLWSLKSLSQSNSNLLERDPSRDWNLYHCPYLLSETLKDKYVVLSV